MRVSAMTDSERRALGALYGLAVGDALGMPTQLLDPAEVRRLFPELADFAPGPPANRISSGMPTGRVTDDTEQALILADLLVEGRGQVDGAEFARRLIAWSDEAEKNGTEQLGPSSRRALALVRDGESPERAGRYGTTNGAAMRIAPMGVSLRFESPPTFAADIADAVMVTHNTGVAIAGAAAVAAAISVAIDGRRFPLALEAAVAAAEEGQRLGFYYPAASIARRIEWAVACVRDLAWEDAAEMITGLVGLGVETTEAVPAAFALVSLTPEDPWTVATRAARLGGDSDTIGAMAGAMAGALAGVDALPEAARRTVRVANNLHLEAVARALLALRGEP